MSDRYNSPSPRHYIIVVHGIGEQRHNETTVEVVNRFATARAKEKPASPYAALLPGSLSSLSMRRKGGGQGWSEFEGIPVEPGSVSEAFDGIRATTESGKNFRFVDMRWADILQSHHGMYGSTTKQWTASLLARLQPPFTPVESTEEWVMPMLKEIKQTLLPIQGLLKWYAPAVEKSIYQDVIGDIHLYGDYVRTRGQAVRRFHAQLDQIHLRDYIQWCRFERMSKDEPYVPPVYTIIAHSLGSVLSFDALLYAFAKESIREGNDRHDSGSLPFPGYTEQEEFESESWLGLLSDLRKPPRDTSLPHPHENWARLSACYAQFRKSYGVRPPSIDSPRAGDLPLLLWRDHVKHVITLGSPIDKFLVLWHHNYRHMGPIHFPAADTWCEGWLDDTITHRITHYNVCDEQDPVGHHLDVGRNCAAYNNVFRTDLPVAYRDVVFRRYAVPGLAHVQYWKDQELFDRLISEVIDECPAPQADQTSSDTNSHLGQLIDKEFFEVDGVYDMALAWAYARIPLIASVTTGLLLSYGWIGWYYWGFSPSSALALLAGILLWVCPRPVEAYRKEVKTEYIAREHPLKKRLLPWKPHRGIFANVVAGAVAWRRILISMNHHPNPASQKAEAVGRELRLSLETAGNFRSVFRNRIIGGALVFLVAAGLAWCNRVYLSESADNVSRPPWWYVAILTLTTGSVVYLVTMGYVGYIFVRMKKGIPTATGSKPDEPSVLESTRVHPSVHLADVITKR